MSICVCLLNISSRCQKAVPLPIKELIANRPHHNSSGLWHSVRALSVQNVTRKKTSCAVTEWMPCLTALKGLAVPSSAPFCITADCLLRLATKLTRSLARSELTA
jgi:hypothetical protein